MQSQFIITLKIFFLLFLSIHTQILPSDSSDCKLTRHSQNFGVPIYGNESSVSTFLVLMDQLKSMNIYYGRIVNGFEFFFYNGTNKSYGFTKHTTNIVANSEKNNEISIDLENKEIKSVKVNHAYWVNTLQFEINDKLTNESFWSELMPGTSYHANESVLNSDSVALNATSFKIFAMSGIIDTSDEIFGDFLQSVKFIYSYHSCPVKQTTRAPSISLRTTTRKIFSTYKPKALLNCSRLSNSYFLESGFNFRFSLSLESLKEIKIYLKNKINGLVFTYENGSIDKFGITDKTQQVDTIDLKNKVIRSVQISEGYCSKRFLFNKVIRFEIYDPERNSSQYISNYFDKYFVPYKKRNYPLQNLRISKIIFYYNQYYYSQAFQFEYSYTSASYNCYQSNI